LIVKWPGTIPAGSVDSSHFVSGIDLMPTVMEIAGLPLVPGLDGRSFLPLLHNEEQENREYAYSSFYQIFARVRYPMRCVQNKDFGYIFNFWSDHQLEIRGDATGGLTWRSMLEAAETDLEIAARVELFKYRVPEEFYNFKDDPDGLNNLVHDPAYAAELNKFRKQMVLMMERYKDPALGAFRDRDQDGVMDVFMEQQREKAKNTRPVEKF